MADKEIKSKVNLLNLDDEQIEEDVQKTLYGTDRRILKAMAKLITFILFFFIYIMIVVIFENFAFRAMVMVFGLVFLTIIFQNIVIPSFKKPKNPLISKP